MRREKTQISKIRKKKGEKKQQTPENPGNHQRLL
jgi:hypothetical protein